MTPRDLVVLPTCVRFLGRKFPRTIGRGGLTCRKVEGDGATPRGVHKIVGMLYRPDRMMPPVDWAVPIGPMDRWSDDVADSDYNLMVRVPHPFSHETLRRSDPMYDLVLITDWNWPHAVPGRGSAIFIHAWRGKGRPTAGCIAFRPDHLAWIATRIRVGNKVVIA